MPLTFLYKNAAMKDLWQIKDDVDYILQSQNTGDALSANYTPERFYTDETLFVSIIYKNDIPFEASTIITRDIFLGGCRVLNRLMVVPELRDKVPSAKIPQTTLTMLNSQIEFIENDYDFAFISRELNSYRFMKRFASDAGKFTDREWHYQTSKFLVCGDITEKSPCWQNVAWTDFSGLTQFPLIEQ